jgi:hypothetical protein
MEENKASLHERFVLFVVAAILVAIFVKIMFF